MEKVSIDDYEQKYEALSKEYSQKLRLDDYRGSKTYGNGKKYTDGYLNNAGKTITISLLKDLGYSKETSEYIESYLRKNGETLAF